jgi:acylphosphatase
VRNVPDGTVEAVVEGERPMVEKAVEWCGTGPPGALVQSIDVAWEKPEGERDFEIRY